MAEEHYRRWLPATYAALHDPATFFADLADEAQSQVEDLESSLRGTDPENEPFAERLARFRWARHLAEEIVLREVLLPDPEITPEDETKAQQEAESNALLASAMEEFQRLRDEL